jgi:hypothetical protein
MSIILDDIFSVYGQEFSHGKEDTLTLWQITLVGGIPQYAVAIRNHTAGMLPLNDLTTHIGMHGGLSEIFKGTLPHVYASWTKQYGKIFKVCHILLYPMDCVGRLSF